jgi:glycosyltransferase involved in cell wall biosynthesis
LWHFPHWAAYRAAVAGGVPYVITAHGQMEPLGLRQKSLAKRFYAPLLLWPSLRNASALQALSVREEAQMRHFGVRNRVWVIPNGVPPSALQVRAAPNALNSRFPHLQGKRVVLFVGRIDPQKGIDLLIEAFAQVQRASPFVHLVVVGPGQSNFARRVRQRARELALDESVTFAGPLYGADRDAALEAATVFVSPSRSEGQSVALLEAMAAGLPVLVTPASNVPDVVAPGAGLMSAAEPNLLAAGIRRLLDDPTASSAMGQAGRALVERRYTWDAVASDVCDLYNSLKP